MIPSSPCIAAILAALGVAAGAFGAHALRDTLSPERLEVWKTAVLYHLLHAVALYAIATRAGAERWRLVELLLVAGLIIFSGSLYLLCLTDRRWLGAITPIGGTLLIAAWILLAWREFTRPG